MASSVGDNGLRTKRSKAQLWQEMKINCKIKGIVLMNIS